MASISLRGPLLEGQPASLGKALLASVLVSCFKVDTTVWTELVTSIVCGVFPSSRFRERLRAPSIAVIGCCVYILPWTTPAYAAHAARLMRVIRVSQVFPIEQNPRLGALQTEGTTRRKTLPKAGPDREASRMWIDHMQPLRSRSTKARV